jgi:MazG family protein
MARLRAPDGCPWDREQTHSTLRTYLIEEAYEVLDALESTDDAKFAEELGDLLLQVLFHAQIASEERRFSISDVIREVHEKMIRRHPHVFGTKRAKTAAEVLRNWESIKFDERRQKEAREVQEKANSSSSFASSTSSTPSAAAEPSSILDGIPRTLPAVLEALQLTRRAARIGFDWDSLEGIFAKLDEESRELRHALDQATAHRESTSPAVLSSRGTAIPGGAGKPTRSRRERSDLRSFSERKSIESELGDLLFVAVNLARFLHIDPEIALKKTSAKFSRRFREMERLARTQGTTLAEVPRPQMEALWDQAKNLLPY